MNQENQEKLEILRKVRAALKEIGLLGPRQEQQLKEIEQKIKREGGQEYSPIS